VNLWGVIHGVRAFLPILIGQGEGHIVNTASIAGLAPGIGPVYDASKHAVVALTEDLYTMMQMAGLGVGVSVLCPGWVRTSIVDSERNWPARLGESPPRAMAAEVLLPHYQRAVDEGTPPALVAERVAEAIGSGTFWILPHPEFVEMAERRWQRIAKGENPEVLGDLPGLPPAEQIAAELQQAMAPTASP
jgi:NAD(P)-dependent dehydrogenase (short-subunit alcohol dehydrogenase family)